MLLKRTSSVKNQSLKHQCLRSSYSATKVAVTLELGAHALAKSQYFCLL